MLASLASRSSPVQFCLPCPRFLHGALQELGCPFSEISSHDSERVLRVILSSQQPDRCRKAQAFITTQGLDPETVAELVAEEVTRELLSPSSGQGSELGARFLLVGSAPPGSLCGAQ